VVKRNDFIVLNEEIATLVADFFSAFSDTSRVRIISALVGGRMPVGEIADIVGISESAVSHHLRGLRQLRLVKAHKEGRQVFYYLDDDHIIQIFEAGVNHVQHD
jgi:DNA-binding transcriptional ArsR family regulator